MFLFNKKFKTLIWSFFSINLIDIKLQDKKIYIYDFYFYSICYRISFL